MPLLKNSPNEFNTIDLTSLKDFQLWKNTNGSTFELKDYYYNTKPEQVIALATFFCPEFIEHEDLIFFKDRFNIDNFNNWKKELSDRQKIQSTINHIHLADIFLNLGVISFRNIVFLAQKLIYMWKLQLEDKYPNLKFSVETKSDEDGDFIIYFFQNN